MGWERFLNMIKNKLNTPVPNAIKLDKPVVYIMNLPKVQLWDLTTNPNYKSVKEFSKGEEFEAYGYIPFNNTKYLVTQYSFDKGIKNGINRADVILKSEPPKPVDKEIADLNKKITDLKNQIKDLENQAKDLKNQISNRDKQIADLNKKIDNNSYIKVSDLYIKK
jgi:hypothetical protein